MKPIRFNLDQSLETLTAHSGLALIGLPLTHTSIAKLLIRYQLPGAAIEISKHDLAIIPRRIKMIWVHDIRNFIPPKAPAHA